MSMIQLIHPIMILFHTNSLIICLKYSICINCINLLKIVNKGAVKVTSDWTVLEKRIYLEYKLFKNRHVNVIRHWTINQSNHTMFHLPFY